MSAPWEKDPIVQKAPWERDAIVSEQPAPTPAPAPMTRAEFMRREVLRSPPVALARGIKDVIDTGAGFLSRLGGVDEQARVREGNAAGRAEFDAAVEGTFMPQVARLGGNVTAVGPLIGKAGAAVSRVMPRFGSAISTGGMRTGAAPTGNVARAADTGIRIAGGGAAGYGGAGLIDEESANTGGLIGAALPAGVKVAGAVGNVAGNVVRGSVRHGIGMTTGVGAEPVTQAFRAGRTGNRDFLDNMRGEVPIDDVLARAKQGLDAMRAAKSEQYRAGMIPVATDKTTLVFDDIDRAFNAAGNITSYRGQVKNEAAASVVARMRQAVDEWRQLDPSKFHTPEGIDALKQKLGAIMEAIPFQERGARTAAGKVYAATKQTIERQAPTYARVMADYSKASEQIMQIERALSLGDRASKDTAMRKLQSLMRNNVQTNYNNRLNLANTLEESGQVDLMPSLAGQAMNSWTPRSLSGQIGSGVTAATSLATGNPLLLAGLSLQSPRLMGNLFYGAGRAADATSNAGAAIGQLGRSANIGVNGPDEIARAMYLLAPRAAASPEGRR